MRNALDLFRGNYPRSMFDIVDDFDDVFEKALAQSPQLSAESRAFKPTVDIRENEKAFMLSFDLPGVKQSDVKLDVSDSTLKISGERKSDWEEKKERSHRIEKFYGRFERSFAFPQTASMDKIEAHFENGVLQVVIPKITESRTKTVEIKGASDSKSGTGLFEKFLGTKDVSKKTDEKH